MPMMDERPELSLKTVIFATDFSLGSQNAGLYAARLAAYFSATLAVVHAFTLSQAAWEAEIDQKLVSQQRKDLKTLLTAKAALLGGGSLKTFPRLAEGDPKQVIPAIADENQPSIVVLGTHGGGRIERSIIGSTAEQILRSTRWPVLTVGPQVPIATSKGTLFERILFATDFTAASANAASFAVNFAEVFAAQIDVMNVIQENAVSHPDLLKDLQHRFYDALDRLVPEKAREFCDPRTFVGVGDAHRQILQHIKERAIDLLVLGIRRSSHLSIEMRTSSAFRIIVDAECPVLTILC